jgi:lipoprotein-releasing system ATP-binding protein
MLSVLNLSHSYKQGDKLLNILNSCSLKIDSGEIVALVGNSGAGKTTLLQLIGLLEQPQDGDIEIQGASTRALNDAARTELRRHTYGFVYQFHHLLPEFSAMENVILPQLIAGVNKKIAQDNAAELLSSLGLSHRFEHRPKQLSGGEQQRVAIARALANKPKILMADEPTGNLDPTTASDVFNLLVKLVKEQKIATIIATHNHTLAHSMDRFVELKDGKLLENRP